MAGRRVALAAVVLVAGCMTPTHRFDVHRASRYIERHPEVPQARTRALLEGSVVEGMTPDEVVICLGKPQERQHIAEGGPAEELWVYQRPERGPAEMERSLMWNRPVPVARVTFGADGLVRSCRLYQDSANRTRDTTQAGLTAGSPTPAPAKPVPAEDTPGPVSAPSPPASLETPIPPTGAAPESFAAWPELTVSGVIAGTGESVAIINRREVRTGETVDGVRILQITAKGVHARMGQATRFIPVNGSVR